MLSPERKAEIEAAAREYVAEQADLFSRLYILPPGMIDIIMTVCHNAYVAGATAEAERAEPLARTAETIVLYWVIMNRKPIEGEAREALQLRIREMARALEPYRPRETPEQEVQG